MPLYNFQCYGCNKESRRLLPASPFATILKDDGSRTCRECGGYLKWVPSPPSARVIEIRDNGLMPRKVEQLADIQEIIKDRSTEPSDPDTI